MSTTLPRQPVEGLRVPEATPLHEGWTLRHEGASLPAAVPGCAHTDLPAAGVTPDPFPGRDETEVAWVGRREWAHERDLGGTAARSPHERAVEPVPVPREPEPARPTEFLVAEADGVRAWHFPAPDREIPYPRPEFEVALVPGGVEVTAGTLVRVLLLQADRLDPAARADRGLVTLLPGERVTIGVRGWENPDAAAARAALYRMEPSR
ncbi:glycosyl hydrolase 2 galactose-binding domain-containing protein [Streptomyces pharetrae]|uniref:glycosyl hydrolase 2 galactose-binding domain-containing protein n=1 Tax=Streptomyces pharetrae TaxID=291370 RepID=UPI00384C0983